MSTKAELRSHPMPSDEIIEIIALRPLIARALWLQSAIFPTKAAHWDTPGEMLDIDKQPYFDLADAALSAAEAAGWVMVPKGAVDDLAKRAARWRLNEGRAWLHVPLVEIRAIIGEHEARP